jgi:hypothetical protein
MLKVRCSWEFASRMAIQPHTVIQWLIANDGREGARALKRT